MRGLTHRLLLAWRSNWMNELARWCPSLTAIKLHGEKEERAEVIRDQLVPGATLEERGWNVLVTT